MAKSKITEDLLKDIQKLAKKTTQKMTSILKVKLAKPIRSDGIISKCEFNIKTYGDKITIQSMLPDYANAVDTGRRAGKMPPNGKLLNWVILHIKAATKDYNSITYLIRRKIAKKGTKGTGFLTPFEQMKKSITRKLKPAFYKTAKKEFDIIIRQYKTKNK